jgi:hypothetical protein
MDLEIWSNGLTIPGATPSMSDPHPVFDRTSGTPLALGHSS